MEEQTILESGPAPAAPAGHAQAELRTAALAAWRLDDPASKVAATRALASDPPMLDPARRLDSPATHAGHPARPRLVPAMQVPRRSVHTPAGRAALLHAVAHIEFNAINLALDAIWRFAGLPAAYYLDWLQVAAEEALHFSLLAEHLATLGRAYGDFDAHDGLWAMAARTAHDPLARMALVPRTLEARGLDATPPMQAKLRAAGDLRAVEILDVILRDEVGHVAIGNRWFAHLCERGGHEPLEAFERLRREHGAPRLKPPFNLEARRRAGFDAAELQALAAGDPS
jgi:uncharacterized ferritin-like protein (DUF455 family)